MFKAILRRFTGSAPTFYLALLVSAIVTPHSSGQSRTAQPRFKVLVEVSGEKSIKDEIASTLSGALRSLGDVDVLFDRQNSGFALSIVSLEARSVNGLLTGYNLAYLGKKHADGELSFIKTVLDRTVSPDCIKLSPQQSMKKKEFLGNLIDLASGAEYVQLFGAVGGSPKDLERLCKQIVIQFDSQVLQTIRKVWEEQFISKP